MRTGTRIAKLVSFTIPASFYRASLLDLGNGTIARPPLNVIGKHLAVQRPLGRTVSTE